MDLELVKGEARFEDRPLHGALVELGNAVVAFFWEGEEPRLGTLTVTLPDRSSSPLLGDRDSQLARILGAQLTALTGKIALVSVNLPLGVGDAAGKALIQLTRELVGEVREEDG
ncbi:MAG: hypothetical protein PVJ38_01805 [Candidatus Bathyarchaeota archaeon]|jgi:hypothetical protein